MLKVILALLALFFIVQMFSGLDVEEHIEPLLAPIVELADEHTDDNFSDLGKQFLENLSSQDLSNLIESQDFDLSEVSSMMENQELNLDKLSELIEAQEFDTEAAQQKLEELQKLVQEKLEENQ